ncbi:MAB_1171c family putative transporter, partial [Streptomyces sp. JHA26]|uniref:MAB_1171c family putative transporter n=1 Tax=Streptomyces sp. JHA26 TaxID=1917143 RepID=UPI0027D7ECD5
PLWTTLTTAYPELVLKEPQAGARRRLRPHRTHEQRFCRRVIECRDGLVCLSPYLAHVASETELAHAPAEELARHITEALALKPAMESAQTELSAVRVAVPPNGDLEADARELIAVSQALQKGSHEQGTDLR